MILCTRTVVLSREVLSPVRSYRTRSGLAHHMAHMLWAPGSRAPPSRDAAIGRHAQRDWGAVFACRACRVQTRVQSADCRHCEESTVRKAAYWRDAYPRTLFGWKQ
eukprot:scaffold118982_cov26-Prasinocladus_malaysianus.AAC.2